MTESTITPNFCACVFVVISNDRSQGHEDSAFWGRWLSGPLVEDPGLTPHTRYLSAVQTYMQANRSSTVNNLNFHTVNKSKNFRPFFSLRTLSFYFLRLQFVKAGLEFTVLPRLTSDSIPISL